MRTPIIEPCAAQKRLATNNAKESDWELCGVMDALMLRGGVYEVRFLYKQESVLRMLAEREKIRESAAIAASKEKAE